MSQTELNPLHKNKVKGKQKTKNDKPVVVINHLSEEHDIKTMVDDILLKKEFSKDSSIFVVVPCDDNDAGNSSDGRNSTICIQLSENQTKWNNTIQTNPVSADTAHRRPSTVSQGVKISAKGKQYFMEALPTTVLSYHNKETMYDRHQYLGHAYHHTHTYRKDKCTKNKLCQITTPNEVVQIVPEIVKYRCNGVGTDTTADRPCCCPPKEYRDYSSNDRYVANVVSTQMSPLLARFVKQVAPCYLPPCHHLTGCHEENIPHQCASQPVKSCNCSPEKLRELLEQAIQQGRAASMKSRNIGVGGPATPHTCQTPVTPIPPVHMPAPNNAPFKDENANCPSCSKPAQVEDYRNRASWTIVKKKTPSCPCEPPKPPVGKESLANQTSPVGLDDLDERAPVRQMGQTQLLGSVEKSSTGNDVSTQVGTRQTRFHSSMGTSTDPKLTCACNNKKRMKKKKCECPEPEVPFWVPVFEQVFEPDEKKNKKFMSVLTQRASGFKFNKKKVPPELPQEEFIIDDAIRCNALMKPELIRDIIEEQQLKRDLERPEWTRHKDSKAAICECPSEPPPSEPLVTPTPILAEIEDDDKFRGLKFSIGGKGSSSPGLAGIACFDLFQECFTTW